jgi:hypothetical protein
MDEDVNDYRYQVGADATVLIVADSRLCGQGYINAAPWEAFSLVSVYCPDALSHEVSMCVCMYVCVCVCMYVCMWVCMCISVDCARMPSHTRY